MGQVASPFPVRVPSSSDEQRVLLHGVPWATYVLLRDTVASSGFRMTYLRGALEIMSPSRRHEVETKQIARLLELFCMERGIRLFGYRGTTFRREEGERGLEPDECYSRDHDRDIPDIAIEVIVSHGLLDKLEVYRGLEIPEVWLFEAGVFTVLALRVDRYETISTSAVLPEVDLARIAHHLQTPDQPAALLAYRDELRATSSG